MTFRLLACLLALLALASTAVAQSFTSKPLRMVVGFPPGGGNDIVARIRSLPDLPTVAEQGIPGYEIFTWYGVFTSGGTPEAVIERLGAEVRNAVADPRVREQLAQQGVDAGRNTPAEFRAFYVAEIARWGRAVKATGIKAD